MLLVVTPHYINTYGSALQTGAVTELQVQRRVLNAVVAVLSESDHLSSILLIANAWLQMLKGLWFTFRILHTRMTANWIGCT